MHKRGLAGTLIGAVIVSALVGAGCSQKQIKPDLTTKVTPIQKSAANAKVKLTIGAKNFTEQRVLGELYAEALSAAGYRVKTRLDLGDAPAAYEALKNGSISGYPEYTGAALLQLFDISSDAVPSGEPAAYEKAKQYFAEDGIVALAPTPFSSTNAVAMTQQKHEELGYDSLAQMAAKAKMLTLSGPAECADREDCLLGLEKNYAIHFKRFLPVPIDQRHQALLYGKADMGIVFTTDPQIDEYHLVVLKDPDGIFPPGNATFITDKSTIASAGPDYVKTINAVTRRLTTPTIRKLNAAVDFGGKTPAQAARDYLRREGYLSG